MAFAAIATATVIIVVRIIRFMVSDGFVFLWYRMMGVLGNWRLARLDLPIAKWIDYPLAANHGDVVTNLAERLSGIDARCSDMQSRHGARNQVSLHKVQVFTAR